MFAVPGWNLAAKSLVPEQAKPVKDNSNKSTAPSQTSANPNKRKRDQDPKKQGPHAISKPRDSSSNDSSAIHASKKHQTKRSSKSEHNAGGSDRNAKRQRGKGSRKSLGTSTSTGANTEPVGPIGRNRNMSHSTQALSQQEEQPQALPHDTSYDKADSSQLPGRGDGAGAGAGAKRSNPPSLPPAPPPLTHLTPLQAKMRAKLTSARFRHLNETLYTTSSSDALSLFTSSPDLFNEYHAGFAQQVKDSWPQNPVDIYIQNVKFRATLATPVNGIPLPRRKPGLCTIADLGCGDAPLARGLQSVIKRLNLKFHNFDLHAPNSHVTKADISALPLHDGEVDLAIFCLSLMGTNWLTFVEEAWRVLRGDGKGEVWVAEVKSRFGRLSTKKGPGRVVDNSVGKRRKPQAGKTQPKEDQDLSNPAMVEDERDDEKPGANDDTDLGPFIESFQRRGFMLREGSLDKSNKMFVSMVFTKTGVPRAGKWKGMKWNGKEYQRMEERKGVQQKRFPGSQRSFTDVDEVDEQEEGKLLKPCVYKLR